MTFIRPFNAVLQQITNKTRNEYIGIVEDNSDPDRLGRLRVRTDLYETIPTEHLPWSYPTPHVFLGASADNQSFSVPEVGTQVRIYYPTGDTNSPYYKGVEINKGNKSTFFDTDYPNCYGCKDSKGNFYIVNKKTGITKYQHSSTTNITIDADGKYQITTPQGHYLKSTASGSFTIDGFDLQLLLSNVQINTMSSGQLNIQCNTIMKNITSELISGDLEVTGQIVAGNGITTSFTTKDGRVIYVENGIITGQV